MSGLAEVHRFVHRNVLYNVNRGLSTQQAELDGSRSGCVGLVRDAICIISRTIHKFCWEHKMRYVNMETSPRCEHFELFNSWDYPHFNMCANVDLTAFYPAVKSRGVSFTVGIIYVLTRAANAIPEFRQRIREGKVVEHEIVHPSTTILAKDDLFSFCTMTYEPDFSSFAAGAAKQIACVQEHPTVDSDSFEDDLLYMTSIPWVSFTSFMHPVHLHPVDSVPRFAWGKYFEEGELLKMPLSVQGHHALMDGLHVGRYYAEVQEYLNEPEAVLGEY